jgi:hypothetical protein
MSFVLWFFSNGSLSDKQLISAAQAPPLGSETLRAQVLDRSVKEQDVQIAGYVQER